MQEMIENTTITKPGRKVDVEAVAEPKTPDREGGVKLNVPDGSIIPTVPKLVISYEGSATEDVTLAQALSGLKRKSFAGNTILIYHDLGVHNHVSNCENKAMLEHLKEA
nr:hypothetical protein Itr_chr08CG13490 [Ipomoea trifida]